VRRRPDTTPEQRHPSAPAREAIPLLRQARQRHRPPRRGPARLGVGGHRLPFPRRGDPRRDGALRALDPRRRDDAPWGRPPFEPRDRRGPRGGRHSVGPVGIDQPCQFRRGHGRPAVAGGAADLRRHPPSSPAAGGRARVRPADGAPESRRHRGRSGPPRHVSPPPAPLPPSMGHALRGDVGGCRADLDRRRPLVRRHPRPPARHDHRRGGTDRLG